MSAPDLTRIEDLTRLVRYYTLFMTTEAASGHPTSSLSAADLMTDLFFRHLRFDLERPDSLSNDRVIFSKGHVSPLVYALWAVAGVVSEKELLTYRKFGSELEGHPTPRFKYAQVASGSLGQGLSVGVGMALAIARGPVSSLLPASARSKLKTGGDQKENLELRAVGSLYRAATPRDSRLPFVYVLMGDGETAEGSVWEAAEVASYYKLNNLVAMVDVNRLGQSAETMLGWNMDIYKARFESFGWDAFEVDGHDLKGIDKVFEKVKSGGEKPKVILAKTVKGKGVALLENKEGWHGKALSREQFGEAVKELGEVDKELRGEMAKPESSKGFESSKGIKSPKLELAYKLGEEVATRKAYGEALSLLAGQNEAIVALDGETSNSTFSEMVRQKTPDQYYEMYIAEQNMAGVALGLSKCGKVPFASTFAAFWTRAYDQVRMAAYSQGNIKYVGSHGGVSIGEDGPSQMGLEDLAMFKTILGSTVLCPADAVSTARLVEIAAKNVGIFYIRTARPATPVIYQTEEKFEVGGSKVLKSSNEDKLVIVGCGVTIHEVLKAYDVLNKQGIKVRVIDAYSIKPLDGETLIKSAEEAGNIVITVEDHYGDGGLGDSVLNVFSDGKVRVEKLAVTKMPMSGRADQLLHFEDIDASAIVNKTLELVG